MAISGSGFLVVRRWDLNDLKKYMKGGRLAIALKQAQLVSSRINKTIDRYKGFEGVAWLLDDKQDFRTLKVSDGLAHISEYALCKQYLKACRLPHVVVLLYCQKQGSFGEVVPEFIQKEFSFDGIDVGYIDEYNLFSSVYHDIIYGTYNELNAFSNQLNDNVLFDSEDDANEFIKKRAELVLKGAHLETLEEGDEIYAVKIYSARNGCQS